MIDLNTELDTTLICSDVARHQKLKSIQLERFAQRVTSHRLKQLVELSIKRNLMQHLAGVDIETRLGGGLHKLIPREVCELPTTESGCSGLFLRCDVRPHGETESVGVLDIFLQDY